MSNYYATTLAQELRRLANGGATYPDDNEMDAPKAANVWAGTTGLDLLAALNVKAGNTRTSDGYRALNLVCNQLAGTSGLEAADALRQRVS